jgi:twitching motility protein PilT
MQTFDQSLYLLYRNGLITLEDALRRATNPDEFKLKIQGIQSTSDVSRDEMDSVLDLGEQTELDPFAEDSPFEFGGGS